MSHGTIILLAGALLAAGALAAVPPLPRERLLERASLVATGRIVSVNVERVTAEPGFVDSVYTIELAVDRVEKGDSALAGTTVTARTWQPAERPRGWAGPQGQNVTPAQGARVRCFLTGPDKAAYELLTPNGLEELAAASTGPSTKPR